MHTLTIAPLSIGESQKENMKKAIKLTSNILTSTIKKQQKTGVCLSMLISNVSSSNWNILFGNRPHHIRSTHSFKKKLAISHVFRSEVSLLLFRLQICRWFLFRRDSSCAFHFRWFKIIHSLNVDSCRFFYGLDDLPN